MKAPVYLFTTKKAYKSDLLFDWSHEFKGYMLKGLTDNGIAFIKQLCRGVHPHGRFISTEHFPYIVSMAEEQKLSIEVGNPLKF